MINFCIRLGGGGRGDGDKRDVLTIEKKILTNLFRTVTLNCKTLVSHKIYPKFAYIILI